MVMDGGHFEDAFLAQLVRPDLQDHRERFEHEDAADERQKQLLLDDDGDGADRAAQGQGSYVAHEDFGWMRVVPKKSDGSSDHRSAEDSQLADLRHALQFEICCEGGMAADVGKHSE